MNAYEELTNYSRNSNIDYVFCDLINTPVLDKLFKLFNTFSYCPWIFSLIGSLLVGLSGVFPLLLIRTEEGENLKFGDGANRLRVLLSFAVGGLLGDVFLHLLPEVWELKSSKSLVHNGFSRVIRVSCLLWDVCFWVISRAMTSKWKDCSLNSFLFQELALLIYIISTTLTHREDIRDNQPHPSLFSGVWVLVGMMVFVTVEKLSSSLEAIKENQYVEKKATDRDIQAKAKVPVACLNNNVKVSPQEMSEFKDHYHISGYLNLMANSVDNFTHGLTIGGSFAISFKMGVLSTFAILVHELPHEIGDFAILLKSGFSRTDAAKAQLLTATAGIMGSMVAVLFDSVESKTSWILPFTAGGFLHIALVTVLPDLVQEESKFESCKQLGSLVFGIALMAFVIFYLE